MSGSGSGGGGGGHSTDKVDCSTLVLKTHLNSPKAAILKTLRKGSKLSIQLESHGGKPIVIAKASQGQAAGSITGAGLASLIQCLQNGFPFHAVVISVAGGGCEVSVQAGA
jgi:hypothetical protein